MACNRSVLKSLSISDAPPAKLRQPTTSSSWTATTHTFVGTGNRVVPSSWPPERFADDPALIPDDPKHNIHYEASKDAAFKLFDQAEDNFTPPRLVAKRYVPQQQGRLTLVMLTGMGLPKEMFEPMIESLISLDVAEIWSIDMPLSGETALITPGYLYGNEKDIARDLMLFLTAYLPSKPTNDMHTELQPHRGAPRPHLHAIAHSLGAQSALLIAAHLPVFDSLTVFDPAIIPDGKIRKAFTALPKDVLCTGIKYEHDSAAALAQELNGNKRTRGWDDRVKQIFVDRGAVEVNGKLRLVAHPRLEWALYYDQETPTHCFERLTDIKVPLNFIMPARPFAVPPKMLEQIVAKMPQKTRLTWVPKSTHQLPFEHVEECTRLVIDWLREFSSSPKL